jgi:hypothetical protein
MPALGLALALLVLLAPDVIPANEAQDHIGEEGRFRMSVKHTNNASKRMTYYLDSEEDFHSDDNLAVVISYDHADAFKKAGIDDPAAYYRGKTIEVTGKVVGEEDQVRIRVASPAQIKVVQNDDKSPPSPR